MYANLRQIREVFMSGVKKVGSQPVSQTQNQDPATVPAQHKETAAPSQPSTPPLSESGKNAKTSESKMSGEAMRQKMLQDAEDLAKPLVDAWKPSDSAEVWGNAGK